MNYKTRYSESKEFRAEFNKESKNAYIYKGDDLLFSHQNDVRGFNEFIKINEKEIWLGTIDLYHFVFYDCVENIVICEHTSKNGFIWTNGCNISPNGKFMLIEGCCWAAPSERALYDISDIRNMGIQMIDINCTYIDKSDDNFECEFVCINGETNIECKLPDGTLIKTIECPKPINSEEEIMTKTAR